MTIKDKVLEFLKHDRTILSARNLYNQLPNKNLAIQRNIARLIDSPANIKFIAYELCKKVGIAERQMNIIYSKPLQVRDENITNTPKDLNLNFEKELLNFSDTTSTEVKQYLIDQLKIEIDFPKFSKGTKGTSERKKLAVKFGLKIEGKKHADYDKKIEQFLLTEKINKAKNDLIQKQLELVSIPVKESIKLRDQFPFLKEKDCPDVLKIIVADLISAYDSFINNQPLLHKNATEKQLKKLVKNVKASYIERKEIFNELDYYKKNKELLGKHSIFERLEKEEALRKLNAQELAKELTNINGNINRNKNKLKIAETEEQKDKYQTLLDTQNYFKSFIEKELSNRK